MAASTNDYSSQGTPSPSRRRGLRSLFRRRREPKGKTSGTPSPAVTSSPAAVTPSPAAAKTTSAPRDETNEPKDYSPTMHTQLTDSPLTDNSDIPYGDEEEKREEELPTIGRDGWPVITSTDADKFKPSQVQETPSEGMVDKHNSGKDGYISDSKSSLKSPSAKSPTRAGKKDLVVIEEPPSARQAAFSGPPRYDWIDIETAAAIKVQSVFRRNQVQRQLVKHEMTTSAMRNKMRANKASYSNGAQTSEDVPSALQFCGVGFLFGDATKEDDAQLQAKSKANYEAKIKAQEEMDERRRQFKVRRKSSELLLESVEVVEDLEDFEERAKEAREARELEELDMKPAAAVTPSPGRRKSSSKKKTRSRSKTTRRRKKSEDSYDDGVPEKYDSEMYY